MIKSENLEQWQVHMDIKTMKLKEIVSLQKDIETLDIIIKGLED